MTRYARALAALPLTASLFAFAPASAADNPVMIVFDGSNSMWGQIDGVAKIEIARGVMDQLLGNWEDDRALGLMAYGHRRRGDCRDIETLVAPAVGTSNDVRTQIGNITPTGKTPLTDAVEQAATAMSYTDAPATVVLISDGLESCQRDPCELGKLLAQRGVDFTAHVVGFGLGNDETDTLACIAEHTGGQYFAADNAEELGSALSAVAAAVSAPKPEPEPEPAPEPEAEVTLTAPDTALAGSAIDVAWSEAPDALDLITIVPMGADEGTRGNHFRVRDRSEHTLRAPSDTGMYEIRYVLYDGMRTLGSHPIEITEPETTVSAPETALAGSKIPVSWTGAVDAIDLIAIVPMGADDGTRGNQFRVRDRTEHELQAPSDPGMYEIRYVLYEGRRTLASTPIEITEPEASVSAPDMALAGSKIPVSWTGTVDAIDLIAIVPMGADEGTRGNQFRVRDRTEHELQAPSDTGMYEIRYVLYEGRRTLASTPIEITEPEVSVTAPAQIRAGDAIPVSWTGTVDGIDLITIVPMGADDGARGNHFRVRDRTEHELKAPDDTGFYEIRYVLYEGRRTLASQPIEVLAADAALESGASIDAPDRAGVGESLEVGWTVDQRSADQRITIARAEQPIFTWQAAVKIDDDGPVTLPLPKEPGTYELRILDVSGQAVLARHVIELE